MMFNNTYSRLVTAALIFSLVSLLFITLSVVQGTIVNPVASFALLWNMLAIGALIFTYRSRCAGFLSAVFCILVVIRILGINGWYLVVAPAVIAFLIMVMLFFYIARQDMKKKSFLGKTFYAMTPADWQLTFIRLYVGFNFIPHCSEKLFAGLTPFKGDVNAFLALGVHSPDFLVILAGLCEFASAIALGLGFLTRIGSIGATLYLLIATLIGKHFDLHFIWASPGGGWEYPVLWMVLTLSFGILGAGHYSLDGVLNRNYKLPRWVKFLMGVN